MGLADIAIKLNWVDLLILILLFKVGYGGFTKGFSNEILPFFGIFACLMVSIHNFILAGRFISVITPFSEGISELLSFCIITLIIVLIVKGLRVLLMQTVKLEVVSLVDRIGGLFFGIARATLLCSLIMAVLVLIPLRYLDISVKEGSLLGPKFLRMGPVLYDNVIRILPMKRKYDKGVMAVKFMRPHWRS